MEIKEIVVSGLIIILCFVLVSGLLDSKNSGKNDVVVFPKIDIAGYSCGKDYCRLVLINSGTSNASCDQVEIYSDNLFVGVADQFTDIYGSPCQSFSPGVFQILKVPELCKGHDRIIVVTKIPNLLDKRITGYYRFNYLC